MKYILALLLLLSGLAFAQLHPKTDTAITQAKPLLATGTQMSELDYYKKMYEQAKESAQASNTQTWSALAVVGGLVSLIIIIQSLSTYRLNLLKIKEAVANQGAETQRVALTEINNQIAADRLATQSRIQEIERQLTATINRELDGIKMTQADVLAKQQANIKSLEGKITGVKQEFVLRDAQKQALAGDTWNILQAVGATLDIAKIRVEEDKIDFPFFQSVLEVVKQMPTRLLIQDFEKMSTITDALKAKDSPIYSTWDSAFQIFKKRKEDADELEKNRASQ